MTNWTPPTDDVPHQPPPAAGPATARAALADGPGVAPTIGLEPAQEIRAEALAAASRLYAGTGNRTHLADVIAVANRFAEWLRTGEWSA